MYRIAQYRAAYRRGDLSPLQVIGDHLSYTRSITSKINALSALNPMAMEEAAQSADRYARSDPIGPLDGIPVIVKDCFRVKGMRRWNGTAIHDGDSASAETSEPVMRLREAGAIIIAKTTMPDMGMLASGISSQFGITMNPWNADASPGGSSAGTAAALAAGLGALGLGTDLAGSVRLPSGHCGLAAIKPTQGRIAYSPASSMRSAGVVGRSVSDVIEGLSVVGTHASSDVMSLSGSFASCAFESVLQRLPRVGVIVSMGYGHPVEPEVRDAVNAAAHRLEQAGFLVELVSLDLTDADFDNANRVFQARAAAEVRASRHSKKLLEPLAHWLEGADSLCMADYEDALNGLLATASKLERRTSCYDFLLCPVIPVSGFDAYSFGPENENNSEKMSLNKLKQDSMGKSEQDPLNKPEQELTDKLKREPTDKLDKDSKDSLDRGPLYHTQFVAWFNQTGQPAGVYREAHDHVRNLPIGVQVVGRRFDDGGVLAVAQYLERTRGNLPELPRFEGAPCYEL
jgi:amidase/aspartyl-tRNA(Asn)/glutamyl-tRNA(Gln) amidotransferase subunit A